MVLFSATISSTLFDAVVLKRSAAPLSSGRRAGAAGVGHDQAESRGNPMPAEDEPAAKAQPGPISKAGQNSLE